MDSDMEHDAHCDNQREIGSTESRPVTLRGRTDCNETDHSGPSIALRPPSISASSTMGEAILLGACLTWLQGLRGPLGWESAEVAGINNVVSKISKATGVDIAHREPASMEPAATTVAKT